MKKKIAFLLVMVMLTNSFTWAAENDYDNTDDDWLVPLILILVGVGLVVSVVTVLVSEADTPDDGIRLASMQNINSVPTTSFGSFLTILQHVEVGKTKDDKMYVGLRFQF